MGKEILTLGDIESETVLPWKKLYFLGDADTEKVLESNKISSSKKKNYKHFIGYLYDDDYKIKS